MKYRTIKPKDVKPGMIVKIIAKVTSRVEEVLPYEDDYLEMKIEGASMIVGREDLLWVIE